MIELILSLYCRVEAFDYGAHEIDRIGSAMFNLIQKARITVEGINV